MKNRHQIAHMAHLWNEVTRLLLEHQAETKPNVQGEIAIPNRIRLMEHDSVRRLAEELKPALAAAVGGAWTNSDFEEDIAQIRARLKQGKYEDARIFSSALVYQRKPNRRHYEQLCARHASFVKKADASWLPAHSKNEEVVERSLAMAERAMSKVVRAELSAVNPATDRWRLFFEQMACESSFQSEVTWILFWSMFLFCADIAEPAQFGLPHENNVNGWVTSILNRRISDHALPQLQLLGYPESMSFAGVFELSNRPEETLLGADFGIYFEINIGDVHCRKVALLQAKKANKGNADVGSKNQQLWKLSQRPQLGYYLFYHHGSYPYQPQGPTVCSAKEIASQDAVRNRDIHSERLPVAVNDLGVAAMHFFTFGLFKPNSGIGIDVADVHEGMKMLGGGSALNLPHRLFAITISNEEHVLQLRKSIAANYKELSSEELLREFQANSDAETDTPSIDGDDDDENDTPRSRPRM